MPKPTEEERVQVVTLEKIQYYNTTETSCGCIDFNIKRVHDPNYKCKHIKKLELLKLQDSSSKQEEVLIELKNKLFRGALQYLRDNGNIVSMDTLCNEFGDDTVEELLRCGEVCELDNQIHILE